MTFAMTFRRIIWPAFPWHPHRGIETITYVLAGTVEHGDSMGNRGAIGRWRHPVDDGRAEGSSIRRCPRAIATGRMHGFQLWANLPSSLKMTAPRYQEVKALEIPDDHGRRRNARSASSAGVSGGRPDPWTGSRPTRSTSMSRSRQANRKTLPVETTRHAFAYVFAGGGKFCNASGPLAVPTEGIGWADTTPPTRGGQPLARAFRQRRRGHRASRRRWHPLPAGLRQASGGAGGLVRPHRDEHSGTTPAGIRRTATRGRFSNQNSDPHQVAAHTRALLSFGRQEGFLAEGASQPSECHLFAVRFLEFILGRADVGVDLF